MASARFPTDGFLIGILQDIEADVANIDCMEDITIDLIQSLRSRISRPLAIPGFPISLSKYQEWEKKQPQESLQGVEYDSRQACLLLRPHLTHPSLEAFGAIVHWIRTLVKGLGNDNPNGWSLQHDSGKIIARQQFHVDVILTKAIAYLLTGHYDGIVKRPLAGLISSRNIRPSVIVHASAKETRMELLDNVKQWLYGSNGRVKLVILVEADEVDGPNVKELWTNGIDCRLFESSDQVATQIFQIEKTELNPSVMGEILTSVWLINRENCRENASDLPCPSYTLKCGLWRVSHDGSVSKTFTGVAPFVDSKFSMHLQGISLSFPFHIFGDYVHKGVMEFLQKRAGAIADYLWTDYEQKIVHESIIRAGYGPGDLIQEPYPLPYC
ncbi:hypothetical protein UA08_09391 [Talaromyces atroroseus]|uniref:Uncharacterized protein n=1 Tax=Talaromyces atroroseus TaxID=1441469 RepID=A0A1Q5Q6E8_TALAT|nr:hypothetical protein UA08_09391 [Talaromyces atroroseus]OKL55320.1 hypothetical protein UA08_09391 [Talaromyces atroroseus]